jgi:hypothetical protein
MLIGMLVLMGLVAAGSVAAAGLGASAVKWAVVNLPEPTMINGSFVMGSVIFQHDDERMARGEPCTKIYKFEPGKSVGEELVSFHCKPRWTEAAKRFTMAAHRDHRGIRVLTEYQFWGDPEAHGVPRLP